MERSRSGTGTGAPAPGARSSIPVCRHSGAGTAVMVPMAAVFMVAVVPWHVV